MAFGLRSAATGAKLSFDLFPNAEVADYQAAIPEWSVAAITVPNGGFKQFFDNHRGGSPHLRRGRLPLAGERA